MMRAGADEEGPPERGEGEPSTSASAAHSMQTRAELALVGTCFIWGTSFVMARMRVCAHVAPRRDIIPLHGQLKSWRNLGRVREFPPRFQCSGERIIQRCVGDGLLRASIRRRDSPPRRRLRPPGGQERRTRAALRTRCPHDVIHPISLRA